MKTICFTKTKKLQKLYEDFQFIKAESELQSNEDFLLIIDISTINNDLEEFILFAQSISSCKAIFVLSLTPSFTEGSYLLSLGVQGYGNLYMQPIHMLEAIEVIHRGDIWLYPHFVQQMIKSFTQKNSIENIELLQLLSKKEKEVANLVKDGLSNKEIALRLDIKERTIKAHLTSIYDKLKVKDRLTLALKLSTKVQ